MPDMVLVRYSGTVASLYKHNWNKKTDSEDIMAIRNWMYIKFALNYCYKSRR